MVGHRCSKDCFFHCKWILFSIACKCAKEAKERGFKLFGLRFYGECFVRNDIDGFERYLNIAPAFGKEHCVVATYQRCYESDRKECVSTGIGECIYKMKQSKSIVNFPDCFFFFFFFFFWLPALCKLLKNVVHGQYILLNGLIQQYFFSFWCPLIGNTYLNKSLQVCTTF